MGRSELGHRANWCRDTGCQILRASTNRWGCRHVSSRHRDPRNSSPGSYPEESGYPEIGGRQNLGVIRVGWDREAESSLAQPDPFLGTTLPTTNRPQDSTSPNLADHLVQEV